MRGAELKIMAEYAALVQPFVSKEETRYYLQGFYVQAHPKTGALIVATNGHTLVVFHDEAGEVKVPGIIRLNKPTLAACKAKDDHARVLVVEGDRATVYRRWDNDKREGQCVGANDEAVIDGQFPNWRAVVPPFPNRAEPASFNGEYLKVFAGIKRAGRKSTAIAVFSRSSDGPAIVLTDRSDFLGVIMPVRAEARSDLPAWLPAAPAMPAAAE